LTNPRRAFSTRDWATMAILSSLGTTLSVTVNYAGNILKAIPHPQAYMAEFTNLWERRQIYDG